MTRTDIVASSRPQAEGAGSIRMGPTGASRRFSGLIVAALLAAALVAPTTALAASTGETGYSQTPTTPKTTTTSAAPTPKSGTSPAKEVSPSKAESPSTAATTATTPTKTEAAKAQTLPFTGLDLRWIVAVGILMMGAGFSIVTVQRRQRRGSSNR